jgi:hypothetical protein
LEEVGGDLQKKVLGGLSLDHLSKSAATPIDEALIKAVKEELLSAAPATR